MRTAGHLGQQAGPPGLPQSTPGLQAGGMREWETPVLTLATLQAPPAWGRAAMMSWICAGHGLQGPVLMGPGRGSQRPPPLCELCPRDTGLGTAMVGGAHFPKGQVQALHGEAGGPPASLSVESRPRECKQQDALLFQKAISRPSPPPVPHRPGPATGVGKGCLWLFEQAPTCPVPSRHPQPRAAGSQPWDTGCHGEGLCGSHVGPGEGWNGMTSQQGPCGPRRPGSSVRVPHSREGLGVWKVDVGTPTGPAEGSWVHPREVGTQ